MRSVRTQLLVGLIVGLGAMSIVAGFGIFRAAQEEANELFDYELHSVAVSLPRSVAADKLANRQTADFEGLQDDHIAINVWDASGNPTYQSVSGGIMTRQRTGFDLLELAGHRYRTYGVQQASRFVQVWQPMSVRDELALKLASRTLWPLLFILPLEIGLVLVVVARALKPINSLSASLAERSLDALSPIDDSAKNIPVEVEPLVEALNDLLTRLNSALHAQRVFVADAAHELRTPLTALKLQIQVAQRDRARADGSDLLPKLEGRVNRAIHLVQQLLMLAREDAELKPRPGAANLHRIATQVVSELSVLAEHKHIDIGLECSGIAATGKDAVVTGDEASLVTMLTNLVDNAIRYTPAGGRVDVRLHAHQEEASLEVVDSGRGIPPKDLDRVKNRFYRAGNTTGLGSGLGLAIAEKVAVKHAAYLVIQNRRDAPGLIVYVRGLRLVAPDPMATNLNLEQQITA